MRCANGVIGDSSCLLGSFGFVDLRFFLVWCMWTLAVYIDGGICILIKSIFKFGHVVNMPFLISCRRVFLNGLNSVVWYHCERSFLVLSNTRLFAD